MSDTRAILLSFIKNAIGWSDLSSIPDDVDWSALLRLSQEHGVLTIFAEGYEKYLKLAQKNSPRMSQALALEFVGNAYSYEKVYLQHLRALKVLSDVFTKAGIPFLVMKGLSCGKYYPNPNHRPCGDIDIYVGDEYEKSNIMLRESGIKVEPHYYRHSVSSICGVTIENHRILCDLRGPRRQTREFEDLLKEFANLSLKQGELYGNDFPSAHYPLSDFNSLFLPWHVSAHFEFEKVTLRHLLDWALFLEHEGKKINVKLFREAKQKFTFGYGPFADILTDLSIRYLELPTKDLPIEIIEDAEKVNRQLADRVFDRMFEDSIPASDTNVWRERWKLFKYIWKDGWKYRALYGMSPIVFLFYKFFGVIFKVGEE